MSRKEKLQRAWRYLTFRASGEEIKSQRLWDFYWPMVAAAWAVAIVMCIIAAVIKRL